MDIIKTVQSALGIYTPVDETKVFGCDTSHWSGIVNFDIAKSKGMAFTIGKAMDGITGPTKYFVENYNGAKKAGILTGMYSWLYKNTTFSTAAQAKEYANLYKQYPTDLPPTIDFEWTRSGNPDAKTDLYDFLIRFEDLTGKKCQIYTAWGYWSQYGSTNAFYSKYPLWVAQYKVSQPNSFAPWNGDYSIFQYTDRASGKDYGYPKSGESMADMNYWHSDLKSLYEFCGLEYGNPTDPTNPPKPIDPPIVIVPEPTNAATVIITKLNVRKEPGLNFPVVGSLKLNDKVTITEGTLVDKNFWGKCEKGWICLRLGIDFYTNLRNFSTIPPKKEVVIPPPVVPQPSGKNLYRILGDQEAGWEPNGPRPFNRGTKGFPSTVRIEGGKSAMQLPLKWTEYLRKCMSPRAFNYVFKAASGWQNRATFGLVESLTFSGNIVEVIKIEGQRAYIKVLRPKDTPPEKPIMPRLGNLDPLVHLFSIQYIDYIDQSTDSRWAVTLCMVDDNNLNPWIDVRNLVKI